MRYLSGKLILRYSPSSINVRFLFYSWLLNKTLGVLKFGFGRDVRPRNLKGALFFGGCVPHGFPKVGSREQIFLKNEDLGMKIWKICILRTETLAKIRLKMQILSNN